MLYIHIYIYTYTYVSLRNSPPKPSPGPRRRPGPCSTLGNHFAVLSNINKVSCFTPGSHFTLGTIGRFVLIRYLVSPSFLHFKVS